MTTPLVGEIPRVLHRSFRRVQRDFLGRGKIRWSCRDSDLPWFDRPEALSLLESKALSDSRRQQLYSWVQNGYFVTDELLPEEDLKALNGVMDKLWECPTVFPNLRFQKLRIGRKVRDNVSHAEVLSWDRQTRQRVKANSLWKVQGLSLDCPAAKAIFSHQKILSLASTILGQPAEPLACINFARGSEQKLHQDSMVFHIHPPNYLVGAWIACEDIVDSSGPFVFYPGSHRTQMFRAFNNYPQTNRRTVSRLGVKRYDRFVERLSRNYRPKRFFAKRGQVLFWHGMLIHGGSAVIDRESTRRSMVIHFSVPGANKCGEMVGPFNW